MTVEYLSLGDYLVIASATLGIPAEELARYANLGLVDFALLNRQERLDLGVLCRCDFHLHTLPHSVNRP